MSDWLFTLRVDGIPMAKGSPNAFVMNRKQIAADPKARSKINIVEGRRGPAQEAYIAWTRAIFENAQNAVRIARHEALDEPLIFCARFYLPRPKSKKKAIYCDTRPDYDKLCRLVIDELERAGVMKNDGRIVKWGEPNGKYYECEGYPPGVWIGIRSANITWEDE